MTTWDIETEEHFVFMSAEFDVRAAKRLLAAKKRAPKVEQLPVADVEPMLSKKVTKPDGSWSLTLGVTVDWERAVTDESIDLEVPVIVAFTPKGSALPIDGYHRIAKAVKQGKTHVPAIFLSRADSKKIRLG